MNNIVELLKSDYKEAETEYMTVTDYLELCKNDRQAYASAAERMVKAIGEPERLDTSADPRLSRIFLNRTLRVYPAFADFYGMEETIERIVGYFKHSAQGLEERKQILYLLGPVGGGKCERAGTLIAMADGSWKKIEDIVIGDTVVSTDEQTHLGSVNAVTNTFVIEDKPLWEVSTSRGLKLQGANTHRLFTNHGWKRIDELRSGDLIATAMKLPFGEQRDNDAFIKVLGYVLGDGHIPHAANLTFTNFNETIVEDFSGAVAELGCVVKPQLDAQTGLPVYYRINEGDGNLVIRKRFEALGLNGTRSETKFIPNFVFKLPENQVALFLSRLYATDGWATVGSRCEIGYASASPVMANQVMLLLSKFGIPARIDTKPTYLDGVRKLDSHVVSIKDRYHVMTFLAKIGIFGKEKACDEVFISIINQRGHSGGFDILPKNLIIEATDAILASKKDGTSRLKNELRTQLDNNIGSRRGFVRYAIELFQNPEALQVLAEGDIYWDKVDTISDLSRNEQMFDIEVEGLHNYVANGIVSHNSSLAERLKELMELNPIYVLCYGAVDAPVKEMSPVFELPLGLFAAARYRERMKEYGIDSRYLNLVLSPWAIKRLKQASGDISKFCVARVMPSKLEQIAVVKTEPGDENNQDISCLVGKTDIRMLEKYSQNDPDSYSFSGALCRGNQGILEFVEMFKAPIKVLHPLLTATQEGNYMGTEAVSAIPFNGIVVAHSNESEWQNFKCFSEDTQLLTKSGWKFHYEVEEGELAATLNKNTGTVEYQKINGKFLEHYEGPMYHMLNKSADHLVTPNHVMLYKQRVDQFCQRQAKDFDITGARLPVSGIFDRAESDLYASDEELRFHVWCITDGCIAYEYRDGSENLAYSFQLKKMRKVNRLIKLLSDLNYSYTYKKREDGYSDFYIGKLSNKYTKDLTCQHRELSTRQVAVLLEEWSHTDGSRDNGRDPDSFSLYTSKKGHCDLIQELCTISGNQCSFVAVGATVSDDDVRKNFRFQANPKTDNLVYHIYVRLGVSDTRCDYINKGTVPYVGKVWCVETDNHTVIARRDGKVIITGNSNKNNEAFIDRVCVIKVPYCLRFSDERRIYEKMLENSELKNNTCAPYTLEMLAQFSVLTRLKTHENSTPWSKMCVYDGKNIKETDPRAKSVQEYRDVAGVDEGMTGTSTRFAFKVLSSTYNHDPEEISADPVHLMFSLEKALIREQYPPDVEKTFLDFIKAELAPRYVEIISDEIQKAYLEAYDEFGQTLFDRYVVLADHWMDDIDYKDPDTGTMFDREYLNGELEKIEKPAGIANPKDFRHECVKFVLRARAQHNVVTWTSYEKLKKVIEKKMFATTDDLLPIISFSSKATSDDQQKHDDFVARMVAKRYTPKQVRRIVDYYLRVRKSA